jgi:putative colanic acid biosynthesis glycosyltransferase
MTIESSGNSGVDTRGRCAMLPGNAMSAAPSLSVVLVCKNSGPRLPLALESIWAQLHLPIEIIVIDGASTDGSRAWLEQQRARVATLVSEPDANLHEAFNKGIALARGEWVLLLGANDRLVGDMVLSEAYNWMKKTEAGVTVGEVAMDDGRLLRMRSRVNPAVGNFMPRSGAFYRRTLFEENGAFDPSLATMADYEFNIRLWKSRVRFKPIPLRIAACAVRELPKRPRWLRCREEINVRHRYFSALRCAPWDARSIARALLGLA